MSVERRWLLRDRILLAELRCYGCLRMGDRVSMCQYTGTFRVRRLTLAKQIPDQSSSRPHGANMVGYTWLQECVVSVRLLLLGKSGVTNHLMISLLADIDKDDRSQYLSRSLHASSVLSPTTYLYTQEIALSTMVPGA